MSDIVILLGVLDGLGGLLLTLQCAEFIYKQNKLPYIYIAARDEVFRPLQYLYHGKYHLHQLPEFTNDSFLYDLDFINRLKCENQEFYVIWPDALYKNPYAFDYKKYNTNPQTIKTTRTLLHKSKPEKIIYVALNTTTENYSYHNPGKLVHKLGQEVKDYIIYCPVLDKWGGKEINHQIWDHEGFYDNVFIDKNPEFIDSLKWLEKSCYCISLDNGVSHISYHLGQQRLLLDPRFGFAVQNPAFYARWRETEEDSIDLKTSVDEIVELIKLNLVIPQTTLLPKKLVLNNLNADWGRELIFKY